MVSSGGRRAGGHRGPAPPGEDAVMCAMTRPPVATVLALPAVAAAPQAQPVQKVVFALNWFAVGDHAAYWVALEKGYYRARGLDVDLVNSKGSGDSIAKGDTGG